MLKTRSELDRFKDANPSWREVLGVLAEKSRPVVAGIGIGVLLGAGGVAALAAHYPDDFDTVVGTRERPASQEVAALQTKPEGREWSSFFDRQEPATPPDRTTAKPDTAVADAFFGGQEKVFEIDVNTMPLAELIEERADAELDAINVIREFVETEPAFADGQVAADAKAVAVREALDLAKSEGDAYAANYDDHVFRLARTLPNTMVFRESVESLNWKRETVRSAIAATEAVAAALESGDDDRFTESLTELVSIMENYEFATSAEKLAEAMVEALDEQVEKATPDLDAGSLSGKAQDIADALSDLARTKVPVSGRTLAPSI